MKCLEVIKNSKKKKENSVKFIKELVLFLYTDSDGSKTMDGSN